VDLKLAALTTTYVFPRLSADRRPAPLKPLEEHEPEPNVAPTPEGAAAGDADDAPEGDADEGAPGTDDPGAAERLAKGSGDWATRQWSHLTVGGPRTIALTPAYASSDPALQAFITGESDIARYILVHLACTFRPRHRNRDSFLAARITLKLAAAAADTPGLEVWSMTPDHLDGLSGTNTVSLNAQALFIGGGAQHEAAGKRKTFLLTSGVHEPEASWRLDGRVGTQIDGSQTLFAVVRCPTGVKANATLMVSADLGRKRRFWFGYKNLPESPVEFERSTDL